MRFWHWIVLSESGYKGRVSHNRLLPAKDGDSNGFQLHLSGLSASVWSKTIDSTAGTKVENASEFNSMTSTKVENVSESNSATFAKVVNAAVFNSEPLTHVKRLGFQFGHVSKGC